MHSGVQGRRWVGWAAIWAAGCLGLAITAAAQSALPAPPTVILSSKEATKLIRARMKPEYPPVAKQNYIQGKVHLQVLVSSEGKVTEANAIRGNALLAASALKTVRQWLYTPYRTSAGAVPFVTDVDVRFSLRNADLKHFPTRPESDFSHQIRPPAMLNGPPLHPPLRHLQVLVSESGRAVDVNPVQDFPAQYSAMFKLVDGFRFRPAHWGSLAVPWYLDVDVPAESQTAAENGAGIE